MNACKCLHAKDWSWAVMAVFLSLLTKSSVISCLFPSPLFLTLSLIDHANEWQECRVEIFEGRWKLPCIFFLLSFYFITTATSLLFSFSLPPSLHLSHSNKHNHTQKSLRKKITSSFVIISPYLFFSCNLSRRISFSSCDWVVGAGNKRVWA